MAAVLSRSDVERVVAAATFAPSILNIQPWRFVSRGGAIELHHDRSRTLPAVDPNHRGLTISCGAALFNLRLAIAEHGRHPDVQTLPDPSQPDHLATVRAGPERPATEADLLLYEAIPRRRTSRVPFLAQPLAPEDLQALEHAALAEGASLHFLSDDERVEVVHLVRRADHAQRLDPAVRAEITRWTSRPIGAVDGLPDSALGPYATDPGSLVRDFAVGRDVPHRGRADFEPQPTLAVLLTNGDDRASWVRAGQALERVWLRATALGLAVSLLTQPLELSHLRWLSRPTVAEPPVSGGTPVSSHRGAWPQAVLRLGIAARSTPHTPRRPVEEVLTFEPDDT